MLATANVSFCFCTTELEFTCSPARCPCNHQITWGQFRISLEGHISSTFVAVEDTTRRHVKTALGNATRDGRMFNPSLPRENIDAQAESTDGRATLYANGQTHMFGRKEV